MVKIPPQGSSLFEVMISLVLISIVFLSFFRILHWTAQKEQTARFTTQAVWLAHMLAERLKAQCTPQLPAEYCFTPTPSDMTEWQSAIAKTLPQGVGEIQTDDATINIQIRWAPRQMYEYAIQLP